MEEILKKWEEFKNRDKTCICPIHSEGESGYPIMKVNHIEGCPARDYLITDFGVFVDFLTKE